MTDFVPVQYGIPIFVALILLEIIWAKYRRPDGYEARDTAISMAFGAGGTIVGALVGGVVVALWLWFYNFRLFDIGWAWWAWALCFVVDDFFYYWTHRSSHRVRWFWAAHVTHHGSQHYNLSTALRQTWTGFFALSFVFRIPLVLIGFHPAMILGVGAIHLAYQFWIHTEAIGRMPRWFEAVLNTPSHHRVHHAVNPRYLDANYSGTFIIWDRLFGTFISELDADPVRYGLVRQLGHFNLLLTAVHEWIDMARDVWRAPWRHKFGYIWRPPGWSHDNSRDTSDSIRARWLGQNRDRGTL
jgi:sterol desaturase/sphingolipid hydroxylase (fatty acid hydroxylase superfamily)